MFLEIIPPKTSAGAQIEARRLMICKIILMELERKNIRSVSLRHTRGIKYKTLRKRLQSGLVSAEEQILLIQHLRLDPDRINFTVTSLGDPELYFTDHCTFMIGLTAELNTVMRETYSALGGGLLPVKRQYEIIARKVQGLVVKQHRRNLARFVQDQISGE